MLSYHDSSCDAIGGFAFPEVFYFENAGVPFDIANNYDVISSQDLSDAMGYLNFHYQPDHRNNNFSGDHNYFNKLVGNCPYLLYYHLWLLQVPHLQTHSIPTLPDAVMQDSLSTSLTGSEANQKSKEKQTGGNNKAVMSALEEIRRGNGERMKCMKERNDLNGIMIQQNAKMLNIADEKHAI